jgi:hypothetical protein
LGGDGSGGSSFGATTAIASLRSLVSIAQKEERENDDRQRGTNRDKEKKIAIGGLQEIRKKGSSSISI